MGQQGPAPHGHSGTGLREAPSRPDSTTAQAGKGCGNGTLVHKLLSHILLAKQGTWHPKLQRSKGRTTLPQSPRRMRPTCRGRRRGAAEPNAAKGPSNMGSKTHPWDEGCESLVTRERGVGDLEELQSRGLLELVGREGL